MRIPFALIDRCRSYLWYMEQHLTRRVNKQWENIDNVRKSVYISVDDEDDVLSEVLPPARAVKVNVVDFHVEIILDEMNPALEFAIRYCVESYLVASSKSIQKLQFDDLSSCLRISFPILPKLEDVYIYRGDVSSKKNLIAHAPNLKTLRFEDVEYVEPLKSELLARNFCIHAHCSFSDFKLDTVRDTIVALPNLSLNLSFYYQRGRGILLDCQFIGKKLVVNEASIYDETDAVNTLKEWMEDLHILQPFVVEIAPKFYETPEIVDDFLYCLQKTRVFNMDMFEESDSDSSSTDFIIDPSTFEWTFLRKKHRRKKHVLNSREF